MAVKLVYLIFTYSFSVLLVLQLARAEPPYTKPTCKDFQCGNVTIRYPFGLNRDCYLDQRFEIWCNRSTNPPTAIIRSVNLEVIDMDWDVIYVKSPVKSTNCTDLGFEMKPELNAAINLTGTPFFFSDRNVFTAVGCNTRALMTDGTTQLVGCYSHCPGGRQDIDWRKTFAKLVIQGSYGPTPEGSWLIDKNCDGSNYCCQITIPPLVQVFDPSLQAKDSNQGKDGCRLAFLIDGTAKVKETLLQIPLSLAWIIDSGDWEYTSATMVCAATVRDESSNKRFLECNCKNGYEGNPYLGCTDIDECNKHGNCRGMTKCVNTPGSYKCVVDSKWIIILVLGGVLGVLGVLFFAIERMYKNIARRKKFFKRNGGLLLQQQLSSSDGSLQNIKVFSSKELAKATDGFNKNRILGQGGQGTVFKGMLVDGTIIAVKKSKLLDEKELQEFVNEIVILSQINHRNVVKLLGCCLETEVPLLVYEFIPNGSLYNYLHDKNEDVPFTWEMRLKIASEVAGALAYLHSAASIPIYHRDIKSTNILLDEKYIAKVSDFGTSRSISIDQTHLTTRVQGTFGYLDPEYFRSNQFTEKSDVYSFGVVLVELLSGKKPILCPSSQSAETVSLVSHFNHLMDEKRLLDIVDDHIKEHCYEEEEIIAVANLARQCLSLDGKKRPTMKEVAMELEGIRSSRSDNVQENTEEIEHVPDEVTAGWDSGISTYFFHGKALSLEVDPFISYNLGDYKDV
ncbi:hypothetical protein JCGZ_26948 [Jatropha curcas]|uniref:Protein kinase domain-containing protein n=1 Tax=Jatropha curcas TaxID=180498 RepID=A0A067LBR0_JATCU|nr:wall-associated receptor kinase-like 22 [Jatropha curcas]KDP41930.1 hypothetical protein JCGZ_26948 [Jatropha curcas]